MDHTKYNNLSIEIWDINRLILLLFFYENALIKIIWLRK